MAQAVTWMNRLSGKPYDWVNWGLERGSGTYRVVKVGRFGQGGGWWVPAANVIEVMEDEPEYDVISDGDVTVTDEIPEDWPITEGPEDISSVPPYVISEPDWPNVHPLLREMSYNVATAYMALTNIVVVPGEDVLYQLQVATATLSDEIRRLSEKGANHG